MRSRLLLLGTLAALVLVPGPSALADAPTITVRPDSLPAGEGPAIPTQVGRQILEGGARVSIPANSRLLGKSGTAYVVAGGGRVLRVEEDGARTTLASIGDGADLRLSRDGAHLVVTRSVGGSRSQVTVLDAETGAREARRTFPDYATVMDADAGRMVVTTWSPSRTLRWDFVDDSSSRIVGRTTGHVDIRADRLATFTRSPHDGGCTVVTSLARPQRTLWRSCQEAVAAFSPNGRRMATFHILTDGLGPNAVHARTIGGRKIATYAAYWFGSVEWETDRALLLDTHTKRRTALVRCGADECERASAVRPQPPLG